MSNVSMVDGHIDRPMNYYERIKNMNIDEMAEYHTVLVTNHLNEFCVALGIERYEPTKQEFEEMVKEFKQLLESEGETE